MLGGSQMHGVPPGIHVQEMRQLSRAQRGSATGAMLGPLWVQTVRNSLNTALRIAAR
jgi:hypothetical protein